MYPIGEFAKLMGVTARTLRFYEDKGLLTSHRHPENQYRFYTHEAQITLENILFLQGLGLSLAEIQTVMSDRGTLPRLRNALQKKRKKHVVQKDNLMQQIQDIDRVLQVLKDRKNLSQQLLRDLSQPERNLVMQTISKVYQFSLKGPRDRNEDFALQHTTDQGIFCALADGMGHVKESPGASQMACEGFWTALDWEQLTPERYALHFKDILSQVHAQIFDQSQGASTLSVLAIKANMAFIAHVGDCRIYRLRQGQLHALTKDHSVVQKLLDAGDILEKDIPTHPDKNKVTSILGYEESPSDFMLTHAAVQPGDRYLLVSDGITRTLSETEILQVVSSSPLKLALEELQTLATRHGEDNASAIGVSLS